MHTTEIFHSVLYEIIYNYFFYSYSIPNYYVDFAVYKSELPLEIREMYPV